MYLKMEDSIHSTLHLFMEIGIIQLEWGRKLEKAKQKKLREKDCCLGKTAHSTQINKPLSNFDLEGWINKLEIKHFRGIFSRDALPDKILKKECGIINLDDIVGQGTDWVCYRNLEKNLIEYFDPFGLIMPYQIRDYLLTSGKK